MVDVKMDGDVLVITAPISVGLDKDGDGLKSLEAGGSLFIKLDGSEIIDELMKSSSLLEKIKQKLGM